MLCGDGELNTEEFLCQLFGIETGYVYAPIKHLDDFQQYWYRWPKEKDEMLTIMADAHTVADCYISPVLWNSEDLTDFKLSNVVWCDFDDGLPSQYGDFPGPSIRVASNSTLEKEHWYWRLKSPCRDRTVLERYNKKLAYALGADRGCWNYGRILRPIDTLNHKYSPPSPVSLQAVSDSRIDEHVFSALPSVPDSVGDDVKFPYQLQHLPSVVPKYALSPTFWEFFSSPKGDGERHNALTSVAMTCVEKGMTRDEAMTFLFDADNRWKKYVGRRDREHRLQSILLYAEQNIQRSRGNSRSELSDRSTSGEREIGLDGFAKGPRPFSEFVRHKFHVDWVIENLIHKQGLAVVAAPPGIGKTQFSLNLALNIAAGKDFLNWTVTKPRRVLFLSLEMMQPELKFYLDKMAAGFTKEEKDAFDKNCWFLARQAFRLNSEANQRKLLEWIDRLQPEGIFIDSLSRCVGGDLEKGEIDTVFDFLNKEVRDQRGCFVWFVHHNRKANAFQKQPKKLEDLYGSQYIGAYASTVLGLWKITNTEIEVNCLKVWLSSPFKSFIMERSPNLTFTAGKTIEV